MLVYDKKTSTLQFKIIVRSKKLKGTSTRTKNFYIINKDIILGIHYDQPDIRHENPNTRKAFSLLQCSFCELYNK